MKKVLLGLLALSAVSMAATITGTETATAGTNVWDSSQTHGEIQIKGTIVAEVPVVKYAVYAGDTKESELVLPDLLINKNTAGEAKGLFVSTPEKIFVKKIDSTGAFQDLEATEIVSFKTNIESGDVNYESNTKWTASTDAIPRLRPINGISTLGKAGVEQMITDLKAQYGVNMGIATNGSGYYINTGSGNFYGGVVRMEQQTNGEIQFLTRDTDIDGVTDNGFENSEYWPMVVGYLAGGKATTPDFKLMVKVN